MEKGEHQVCMFCGQADGAWDDECKFSEDGNHGIQIIYPVESVEAETLCCELCGKEWAENAHCELTNDGRHRYQIVKVNFIRQPIKSESILKGGD